MVQESQASDSKEVLNMRQLIFVKLMTQKKRWIGGNLLTVRTQTINKRWMGGNPLFLFFWIFIFA